MKYTLAIALLLNSSVLAINSKTSTNLNEQTKVSTEQAEKSKTYLGRFMNAQGQAVDLEKDSGYHKIELTQQKKYITPADHSNLQINACGDGEEGEGNCKLLAGGDSAKVHIPQKNLDDNVYIGTLFVGTPPQKVRAVFDTGSTNTWIINKKTEVGREKELSYDDEASSTKQKTEQKAKITFGSGKLAGHFYTDNVRIGSCTGDDKGLVQIKAQKFGNVEKQKTIFTGSNFEGIVGLAYPALAEKNVTPIFDTIMDQKLLKSNIFAFSFASGDSASSDLTLGYYDKEKFTGEIAWNDVTYKYMYGVKLDDLKVNGKSTGVCSQGKDCLITFDSGTSLMSIPTFADDIMSKAGIPTFDSPTKCNSPSQFGDLTFVIGGKDYTMSNHEWIKEASSSFAQTEKPNFGPIGPELKGENGQEIIQTEDMGFSLAQQKSKESPAGEGSSICRGLLQKMDISRDQFLVGAVFMRKFYTIFDRDNDKVGLATASGGSGAKGGSSGSLSELSQVTSLSQNKKGKKENRKDLKKALDKLHW